MSLLLLLFVFLWLLCASLFFLCLFCGGKANKIKGWVDDNRGFWSRQLIQLQFKVKTELQYTSSCTTSSCMTCSFLFRQCLTLQSSLGPGDKVTEDDFKMLIPVSKGPHYQLEVEKKKWFVLHWELTRVQSNHLGRNPPPSFLWLFSKIFLVSSATKQYQKTDCWQHRTHWKSEPSSPQQRLQLSMKLPILKDFNCSSATRQSCNCSAAISVSKRIPTTQSPLAQGPFVRKLL